MGILYIGTILDEWKKNWRTDMKYTIFHEITHVLGFSMSFFPSLNMVKKEGSIYYINSPKVLEQAKIAFWMWQFTSWGSAVGKSRGEQKCRVALGREIYVW